MSVVKDNKNLIFEENLSLYFEFQIIHYITFNLILRLSLPYLVLLSLFQKVHMKPTQCDCLVEYFFLVFYIP